MFVFVVEVKVCPYNSLKKQKKNKKKIKNNKKNSSMFHLSS
jgi:hypothetical protein